MKNLLRAFNTLILLTFFMVSSSLTYAQENTNEGDLVQDSLTDISVVVAAGVGGAILGVSTLPFVEEPKEHLNSILVGGAIGIILGVGAVAYKQAMKGGRAFSYTPSSPEKFNTSDRLTWHRVNHHSSTKYLSKSDRQISTVNYSFTF